jgi:hypothetical protein
MDEAYEYVTLEHAQNDNNQKIARITRDSIGFNLLQ